MQSTQPRSHLMWFLHDQLSCHGRGSRQIWVCIQVDHGEAFEGHLNERYMLSPKPRLLSTSKKHVVYIYCYHLLSIFLVYWVYWWISLENSSPLQCKTLKTWWRHKRISSKQPFLSGLSMLSHQPCAVGCWSEDIEGPVHAQQNLKESHGFLHSSISFITRNLVFPKF